MKKIAKILTALMLSVVLFSLLGCPNAAGGDPVVTASFTDLVGTWSADSTSSEGTTTRYMTFVANGDVSRSQVVTTDPDNFTVSESRSATFSIVAGLTVTMALEGSGSLSVPLSEDTLSFTKTVLENGDSTTLTFTKFTGEIQHPLMGTWKATGTSGLYMTFTTGSMAINQVIEGVDLSLTIDDVDQTFTTDRFFPETIRDSSFEYTGSSVSNAGALITFTNEKKDFFTTKFNDGENNVDVTFEKSTTEVPRSIIIGNWKSADRFWYDGTDENRLTFGYAYWVFTTDSMTTYDDITETRDADTYPLGIRDRKEYANFDSYYQDTTTGTVYGRFDTTNYLIFTFTAGEENEFVRGDTYTKQ